MGGNKNQWVTRRWVLLIEESGGGCQHCAKAYDLEFAHVEATGLCGKGRGKSRRLRDILRYPTHYLLLCMSCHDLFDGRPVRRRQSDYD